MEYQPDYVKIARWAKALGHPVRVFIIKLLLDEYECYSGDLAQKLPIARSTLSQHLKELKQAELIVGEMFSPKIRYTLNEEVWSEVNQVFGQLITSKPFTYE